MGLLQFGLVTPLPQAQAIVYHGRIHVANAVAIDGGLITPVIKDANLLGVTDLNAQWKDLVGKVRILNS